MSHPTCQAAAAYYEAGIKLKTPSSYYPLIDSAVGQNLPQNILHAKELLKGVLKGTHIGPFKYTGQTHSHVS